MLQAHRLHCQGRSLSQIAEQLGCARSTAAAYLHDRRIHHHYVLKTAAADQLLDHIELLTEPDQDPVRHQQRVAAARELRLILTALPKFRTDDRPSPQDDETAAIALARSRNAIAGPDGHSRLENGRCAYNCPRCKPEFYEQIEARLSLLNIPDNDSTSADNPDIPGQIETNQDSSHDSTQEFGHFQTNLDKSGPDLPEFPAIHAAFSNGEPNFIPPPEPNPQPRRAKRIRPQYP